MIESGRIEEEPEGVNMTLGEKYFEYSCKGLEVLNVSKLTSLLMSYTMIVIMVFICIPLFFVGFVISVFEEKR